MEDSKDRFIPHESLEETVGRSVDSDSVGPNLVKPDSLTSVEETERACKIGKEANTDSYLTKTADA